MGAFFMHIINNMDRISIINNESPLVELGERKFKKQILRFGEWNHATAKNAKLVINKEKALEIIRNFKNGAIENIPVFLGHHTQREAESNPDLIGGYVENLELTDDGIDAVLNIKDRIAGLIGDTYKNVSAAIDESYQDHESGDLMGMVAKHIALVTEPYIKKLQPFIALSEEGEKDVLEFNLVKNKMKKNKEVKLEEVEKKDEVEETTTVVTEEKPEEKTEVVEENKEEVKEEKSEDEKEPEDKKEEEVEEPKKEVEPVKETEPVEVVALSEVDQLKKKLAEQEAIINKSRKEAVVKEFDTLLSEGKILPAMKDEFIALSESTETIYLSDDVQKSTAEVFKDFVSKLPKLVELGEKGSSDAEAEIQLTDEEKVAIRDGNMTEEQIDKYVELKRKENKTSKYKI